MSFRDHRAMLCLALLCGALMPSQGLDAASAAKKDSRKYPAYLIGPGDLLSITVFGEAELPRQFLVDSDGTIAFPFVGDVKLEGYTQGQASAALEKLLSPFLRAPQVTVLIEETNSYTISVLGEVGKPGRFRIRGIPTLLHILAEAGGPLQNADLAHALLIREERKSVLNLNHIMRNLNSQELQPILYPGDTILIPRSRWPSLGEWGIIVSILASTAVLATTVDNLRSRP